MKAFSVGTVTLALAAGLAVTYLVGNHGAASASEALNGAYRDGIYQGQRTANSGRAPHIAVGRWSTQGDRDSFAAGYHRAYAETIAASNVAARVSSASFRDGLFWGSLAAKRGDQPHLSVGRWATDSDRTRFTDGYLQAYSGSLALQTASTERGHESQ